MFVGGMRVMVGWCPRESVASRFPLDAVSYVATGVHKEAGVFVMISKQIEDIQTQDKHTHKTMRSTKVQLGKKHNF